MSAIWQYDGMWKMVFPHLPSRGPIISAGHWRWGFCDFFGAAGSVGPFFGLWPLGCADSSSAPHSSGRHRICKVRLALSTAPVPLPVGGGFCAVEAQVGPTLGRIMGTSSDPGWAAGRRWRKTFAAFFPMGERKWRFVRRKGWVAPRLADRGLQYGGVLLDLRS